jgi:hypothetical protein
MDQRQRIHGQTKSKRDKTLHFKRKVEHFNFFIAKAPHLNANTNSIFLHLIASTPNVALYPKVFYTLWINVWFVCKPWVLCANEFPALLIITVIQCCHVMKQVINNVDNAASHRKHDLCNVQFFIYIVKQPFLCIYDCHHVSFTVYRDFVLDTQA